MPVILLYSSLNTHTHTHWEERIKWIVPMTITDKSMPQWVYITNSAIKAVQAQEEAGGSDHALEKGISYKMCPMVSENPMRDYFLCLGPLKFFSI